MTITTISILAAAIAIPTASYIWLTRAKRASERAELENTQKEAEQIKKEMEEDTDIEKITSEKEAFRKKHQDRLNSVRSGVRPTNNSDIKRRRAEENDEDDIILSGIVGAATGDVLLGTVVGGSIVGAGIGAMLSDTDDMDDSSHFSTPSYESPSIVESSYSDDNNSSYGGSSYDSSSSYDSGSSSFDSGSSWDD